MLVRRGLALEKFRRTISHLGSNEQVNNARLIVFQALVIHNALQV